MQKECSKCHEIKDITHFIKDKKKYDGLYPSCKDCNNKRIASWHQDHNEEFASYQKEWSRKNRSKVTQQQNNWRKRQPKEYHLVRNLSYRLKIFCNDQKLGHFRTKQVEEALGCSREEFIIYIESKFKEGMSWNNYGKNGWEIDHIKPLIAFDWSIVSSISEANHYTNLQPMWLSDNRSKSGRWTPDTIRDEEN